MTESNRKQLINLCERVLEANVNLEQANKEIDIILSNRTPVNLVVIEDLRDALTHTPGFFFKSGVDLTAFKSSAMYRLLELNVQLLSMNLSEESFLSIRQYINSNCLSSEVIQLMKLLSKDLRKT